MFVRTLFLFLFFSLVPAAPIPDGVSANGNVQHAAVSADGRFVVFESDAANLVQNDTNEQPDVFLYDRQSGETRLVSISPAGQQGDGPSGRPAISGNGRFVVFESEAANLIPGDVNGYSDIFALDRLTGLIMLISTGRMGVPANGASVNAVVDHDGRYFAFQSAADNLVFTDPNPAEDVFIFDRVTGNMIQASAAAGNGKAPAISGDGRIVVFTTSGNELILYHRVLGSAKKVSANAASPSVSFTGRNIAFVMDGFAWRLDRETDELRPVPGTPEGISHLVISDDAAAVMTAGAEGMVLLQDGGRSTLQDGAVGERLDLSADGRVRSFDIRGSRGYRQVQVDAPAEKRDSFHIAGRVTDVLGRPVALVTVSDGKGGSTRTDADGYFYLSGYPAGVLTLTAEKEGFEFEPQVWNLSVIRDVAGYLFTASPEEKLLEEAEKDLGMPYDFNRGCDDPYIGCGKAFHGFSAGYCTDLILDAYTYGLAFDIHYALQQDAYAHPEHFYRWRDARNAHDMWRYFYYSDQLFSHDEDYLPGDAVFFDWSGDGEIDHVALVSDVVRGRPVRMMDATGETEQNPGGLAAELEWLSFHERTVRGHARWSGAYEPVYSGFPQGARVLQTALSGQHLFMRILDYEGRAVSFGEQTLPGARFFDLEFEEVISVLDPKERYVVEIRSTVDEAVPYIFTLQTLSDGLITGRAEMRGSVQSGEVVRIVWRVDTEADGSLSLSTDKGLRHARIKGQLRKP